MDFSPNSFIDHPASDLPTPSLILSKPVLERNIQLLLQDVKQLGIAFRPHVKTLKSVEVTRMMLGNGIHRRIVASTLAEIRGALTLVKEGVLDECLYSLPIYPGALPQLAQLRRSLKILLMVDNEAQVQHLENFARFNPSAASLSWDVFIKIDVGSHRAGVEASSPALAKLIRRVEESPVANVYGFYCHAGHSYGCRTTEAAASVLRTELEGVLKAAELLKGRKVVLSVGSTPTAHVVRDIGKMPDNMEVELHAGLAPIRPLVLILMRAGNFPVNDLQQVATGLVTESQQAVRVLTEVCSVYPERNEALINAGTIALSKETSDTPGYGRVTDRPHWSVMRMSQEHGILGLNGTQREGGSVAETFRVGDKVYLFCQHACITSAAHFVYYVVDEQDVVRETWVPWKGW